MDNKQFELKITWKDVLNEIAIGCAVFLITLGMVVWFVFPFVVKNDSGSRFFLFFLLLIALLSGTILIVYFALQFSYMLIVTGIEDIRIMLNYQGIIYLMNEKGLSYYENKTLKIKKWVDIVDVGCFKQEHKKIKVLYKYQIKFSDGTEHEFNLRGRFPTKEFKDKIEEFWLRYTS